MLNYTWDDVEAELVLRNLEEPSDEGPKFSNLYLKLREEYRTIADAAQKLLKDPE